jgi:hypothetical protein
VKAFALALLFLASPSIAAPTAKAIADYRAVAERDGVLATVGYRLVRANHPFCAEREWSLGWKLHDIAEYPDKALARAAYGFEEDIEILALARNGPAQRAGFSVGDGPVQLRYGPNSALLSFGSAPAKPSTRRVDEVNQQIQSLLEKVVASGHGLIIDARRPVMGVLGMGLRVEPEQVCKTLFWQDPRNKVDAGADGERVRITTGMMAFAGSEDELAAVVAHELAHNLLGHRARLDGIKRGKTKAILETEEEADRLSVWLMANAGFDPTAALRFNERYGRKYGLGVFSDGTHHRWKERVEIIQAEIDLINATAPTNGRRDPPLLQALRNQQ